MDPDARREPVGCFTKRVLLGSTDLDPKQVRSFQLRRTFCVYVTLS